MAHDSSLEPILQKVEPAVRLVPERYLREVLHYLIDRGYPLPTNTNLPLWVARDTLLEAELLPAHLLTGAGARVLLVTDPDDRMIDHLPVAEQLQLYWRVLFQAAVVRELGEKVRSGTLTPEACRERLDRYGAAAAREVRYVLESEHLASRDADDVGRYTAFVATYLDLAAFNRDATESYFPSLPHGDTVRQNLAQDVDVVGLLAATRPDGAADPQLPPEPDERWITDDSRVIEPLPSSPEPRSLLGQALEAERKGNNVRAAILLTQAASTLPEKEQEAAITSARAALGRLVESLGAMFDWDDDTRQEWRQALGPLLAPAAAGIWTRAARCLYELQKIPADLSREVFAIDLPETIRTFGRRPVKRALPHARPVLILMGLKRAYNQMLRTGLGHGAQLRLDRLFHHQIHRLDHDIRRDFTPILTRALTDARLIPTTTAEVIARDKLVAELLDRVCDRGYLRFGDLRDAIARNQLKMGNLDRTMDFFRGDALLRADVNLAYALDGVYRKGEFYLRGLQRFSSVFFGTPVGRWFTLYLAIPFLGAFLALMFTEHVWHKVDKLFGSPAVRVNTPAQPPLAPINGPETPPQDVLTADEVGVDDEGEVWFEPRDSARGDERDLFVTNWFQQAPAPALVQAAIPLSPEPTDHDHGEPTFLTHRTTILSFGIFLLLVMHVPPFRRAVFFVLRHLWRLIRGMLWDLPLGVWRSPLVRELRQSRAVRLLYRHFWSPLLITALVFGVLILLGVRTWFLMRWGWAIWAGLTLAYNSPWGWVLQDRITEALSDWWRVVRVNLIPGLIDTFIVWFKMLGNWIERKLYAVDEWLRFRGGDSQGSLAVKALLGLVWFPIAYTFRFVFYVLVEPQINPVKHFPVVTVSHKVIWPLVPDLAEATGISPWTAGMIINGIPGIFGFIAWELRANWLLYAANRSEQLKPVTLGSHGESMRGLLRPGFHSGTVPKLYKKLRHMDRSKAGRLHHEIEHSAEGVQRFVEREFIHLLAHSNDWGGVRLQVGSVRFGCQRATIELTAQALGKDPFVLSVENINGHIEAFVDQVGWIDKLTEPQQSAFITALRGLLDMAAVEQIDGRIRVETAKPLGPGLADLARRVSWVEWVERWQVRPAA